MIFAAASPGPKGTLQEAAVLGDGSGRGGKNARARLPAELLAGGSSSSGGGAGGRKLRGSTRKPSSAAR